MVAACIHCCPFLAISAPLVDAYQGWRPVTAGRGCVAVFFQPRPAASHDLIFHTIEPNGVQKAMNGQRKGNARSTVVLLLLLPATTPPGRATARATQEQRKNNSGMAIISSSNTRSSNGKSNARTTQEQRCNRHHYQHRRQEQQRQEQRKGNERAT